MSALETWHEMGQYFQKKSLLSLKSNLSWPMRGRSGADLVTNEGRALSSNKYIVTRITRGQSGLSTPRGLIGNKWEHIERQCWPSNMKHAVTGDVVNRIESHPQQTFFVVDFDQLILEWTRHLKMMYTWHQLIKKGKKHFCVTWGSLMACRTIFTCCPTLALNSGKSPILWSRNCTDQTFVKTALPPDRSDTEREGRKSAMICTFCLLFDCWCSIVDNVL